MLGKERYTMSDRRSLTSAANGRKSRGPVTPEGKARSARNSTRHGLFSQALILPHESTHEFEERCKDYHRSFAPANHEQALLVDAMVAASWRLKRCMAIDPAMPEGPSI